MLRMKNITSMLARGLAGGLALLVLVPWVPAMADAHAGPPAFAHARYKGMPKPLPDLPLQQAGRAGLSLSDLGGRWLWIYMGYASCPDVCPTALNWMANAYGRLRQPGRVQPVFLSVDPGRDTPEKLSGFAGFFNPAMIGVTSDPHHLKELAYALQTSFRVPAAAPGEPYLVSHPHFIYVLNPQGQLAAVYDPNLPGSDHQLADDVDALPISMAAFEGRARIRYE